MSSASYSRSSPFPALLSALVLAIASNAADRTIPSASDLAGGQPVSLDTDPHLVAWWQFDETAGKTARDSSRQAHQGTLTGALSFDLHSAPGRRCQALRLDGNDDAVKVAGFKGVTGTLARSVAVWIKTPSASGEIVTWGAREAGKLFVLGHVRGRIGLTPKGGYLYMKAGTDDDQWHHVAVVVQAASPPNLHDHVQLFKDGALAEIDDIGLLDLWPIETGDQLDVTIGRGFKGLLDDLRIYDRALSEDEVQALFKLETSRPLAGP